jgi:hypothetical protein
MQKVRALLSGALLLVAGTCFAEDRWLWDGWPDPVTAEYGPNAAREFAALSESGRAAYKVALVACSLYADRYYDPNSNYKNQCETDYKSFEIDFGSKYIGVLFDGVMRYSRLANREFQLHTSPREMMNPNNEHGKEHVAALQKIYREGNLHAASVITAPPIQTASNAAGQILIPLQRKGGTFVTSVQINKAITLNFVVDSGAADVTIPDDVVSTLLRTGTLEKSDFIGSETYKLADGSTAPSATFRI